MERCRDCINFFAATPKSKYGYCDIHETDDTPADHEACAFFDEAAPKDNPKPDQEAE